MHNNDRANEKKKIIYVEISQKSNVEL